MPVNKGTLQTLGVQVTAAYKRGLIGGTPTLYNKFSTPIKMGTGTVEGPIVEPVGPLQEWKGDRQIQTIVTNAHRLTAKRFEKTIGIDRVAVEDDTVDAYMPAVETMGLQTQRWPDQQVFAALKANALLGYDNKALFADDHPEGDSTVANQTGDGTGTNWYLFDTAAPMKAMVWGLRKAPEFTARQSLSDPNVFERDEYQWGVRARGVAAVGYWQTCYRSNGTLNSTNFETAENAIMSRKDNQGETLGLSGKLLIVPTSLKDSARRLFGRSSIDGGDDNIHHNAVQWAVAQRLD